jgi:phosphatidylglycerophosphate synthase
MLRRSLIPLALTVSRAALAPVIGLLAIYEPEKMIFGCCLTVAFLSDVFDGIIARRLGVATPALRRFDSIADSIFYLAALSAAWRLYPSELEQHLSSLLALASLELARFVIDLVKFRQQASYHMYSSKIWGICLYAAFMALLAFGRGGLWIDVAIYVGLIADLEGLAISIALRSARTDVPTMMHALRRPGRAVPIKRAARVPDSTIR